MHMRCTTHTGISCADCAIEQYRVASLEGGCTRTLIHAKLPSLQGLTDSRVLHADVCQIVRRALEHQPSQTPPNRLKGAGAASVTTSEAPGLRLC